MTFPSSASSFVVHRFRTRFHLWLGICALLLAQFLPAKSHLNRVVSSADGEIQIQICAAHEHRSLTIAASESARFVDAMIAMQEAGKEPASNWFGFCPDCCFQLAADLLLPELAAVGVLQLPAQRALPPLFLHAPRPLFAWSPSSPRAPPVLSA